MHVIMKDLRRWIHAEPLLAVMLWGGMYPGARLALREIPVVSFTCLRLMLGAAVLGALWMRLRPSVPRRLWVPLVNAGIAQVAVLMLGYASLHTTTAGKAAILLATSPILMSAWLAIYKGDHLDGRRWGGLLVGLAGVCLVVRGTAGGLDWSHTVGDLLAIAGAAAWVWFSLAFSPVVGTLGMWRATGLNLGIAALVLSPFAVLEAASKIWWGNVSKEAWSGLIYAAVVGGVVSTALWGRSMVRLGSRQTMMYAYLEPMSAVVIAAILLGESLSAIQAAGASLTLLGVWLASDFGS
jgi:drug/metabolite transporter (DMT)-like permease